MYASHDRSSLEAQTIEAHGLYIEALTLTEWLTNEVDSGAPDIAVGDLMEAECLLAERRCALMELLSELGYMPDGLSAKLPCPSSKGGHRPDATSDPDIASLLRSYLAWRGTSASVETGLSARSMLKLGRALTLLGVLSVEDEAAEERSGRTQLTLARPE